MGLFLYKWSCFNPILYHITTVGKSKVGTLSHIEQEVYQMEMVAYIP